MKRILLPLIIFMVAFSSIKCTKEESNNDKIQCLKSEFIEQRFGMFICYNIMSYGAGWGEANYDISCFDPQKIDCEQWAKAAKSAGMTFGLLTTKHHEGFCLWDSKYTEYDVASTPYKKDIVKQYVDAFRKYGLDPALYYSIWDSSNGIDKGKIDAKAMEFIKGQLTELLSNYGEIKYLVFDGWFWRINHLEVEFNEIRAHIRNLQPNCLITDHTHMQSTYHVDIPYFEGPFGAFPPEDNEMASALGHCSVKGNGWFWSENTPDGLKKGESAATITHKLQQLESRYCNFMLNCMPNRDGLLDTLYIDLLTEIGEQWKPDLTRAPLPIQEKTIVYEIRPERVEATSGNPNYTIDASKIAGKNYYDWIGDSEVPQSITFDFGNVYDGFEIVSITPRHRCKPRPEESLREGNIIHCKLYKSIDGKKYKLLKEVNWNADAKMKSIEFKPTKTRFLKLEILDYYGNNPIINEMAFGAYRKVPVKLE